MFQNAFTSLRRRFAGILAWRGRRAKTGVAKPAIEVLESRDLLATLSVANLPSPVSHGITVISAPFYFAGAFSQYFIDLSALLISQPSAPADISVIGTPTLTVNPSPGEQVGAPVRISVTAVVNVS